MIAEGFASAGHAKIKRSREAAFERKRHLAWAFVPDGLLRLERKRKADDGDTC
ncbi:hypothetical protein HA464_36830 (plasmid) [Rhizobium leguminosarum bv. trifolii]|jgi:hypothetical protein|uniref:hypothetical protein n=1 Tax=Rhizobium ruizarguesonis TaxID=2081791 RepID=UPI00041A5C2B|nr:hypothetical protein [Rhizobium ruizarguesonis]QIO49467.1 hypothetical protein HA464_36830 [Rhizobium leguminosarum bv. trifolii]QJS32684.1 hypothetical protein RLTA1_36525 [Rhizobium leguminosarum bv. trifolii TA1]UFW99009.1 hypothetical protein RlegTA1_36565 [Rhizobium ruizarguesonis]WSH24707.1 hypothetical protein U8Q07_34385 [Rhizobium ruizarguesonis]WSH36404.1 hypothetical protein U8P70_27515 [Rhizobium ruizarguesonis]